MLYAEVWREILIIKNWIFTFFVGLVRMFATLQANKKNKEHHLKLLERFEKQLDDLITQAKDKDVLFFVKNDIDEAKEKLGYFALFGFLKSSQGVLKSLERIKLKIEFFKKEDKS